MTSPACENARSDGADVAGTQSVNLSRLAILGKTWASSAHHCIGIISLFFAGSGGSSSRQIGNGIANGISNREERRRYKNNGYSLLGFHESIIPSKHLQH
ncbi:hypothetical protein PsorP6_006067 [Peronosclerospora sorghi]|uniref:Uncharacterized protein n=1 Tax=Peronosclerospora sorghi TaxID=230839 RepID=A0ACC0W4L1_9STRA|nr:hypothetical protein PsorP6_006067 [Peronosclerospora sorghi]